MLDGRLTATALVAVWLGAGFGMSFLMALSTYFLLRGKRWARGAVIVLTLLALVVQLPLCWLLFRGDGLVREYPGLASRLGGTSPAGRALH